MTDKHFEEYSDILACRFMSGDISEEKFDRLYAKLNEWRLRM